MNQYGELRDLIQIEERGGRIERTKDYRIDTVRTIERVDSVFNPIRKKRLKKHTKRIRAELRRRGE